MGYDLHITRREDWSDDENGKDISFEEWLEYVVIDPELELTNGYRTVIPEVVDSFQDSPGFCNWNGHSTMVGDSKPWFQYSEGSISTKYPDDETIRKMIAMADKLQAKVLGDDGEFYDETYFEKKETEQNDRKPWWKFWS